MNIFLQTHIVKKGETLEQISAMYQIPDVEILKFYHYQNVPKNANHLGTPLLSGQEIFIPGKKEVENILLAKNQSLDEKNSQVISLVENNTLLPVFLKIDTHYLISVTDFVDDILKNTIDSEVYLKCLGKKEQHYIFSYNKKVLFVNGEKPDLKIYELAQECSACLFPAELQINTHGKIQNINNYREILNRWTKIKQNLLKKYNDPNSLKYINDVNDSVDVREELIDVFRRDLFLQLLFAPYFKKFNLGKAKREEYFSEYQILYQSQYSVNIDHEIYINQHSECIDQRSQQEIINHIKKNNNDHDENDLLESVITANYDVHKDHKTLQRADVTIESFLYQVKERTEIKIDIK